MFHVCGAAGETFSFLCPAGTTFNQRLLTCDYWYHGSALSALTSSN